MWRFDEEFMESCIAEAPSAFLKSDLSLIERQYTIDGFRPDLIFDDSEGKFVIVEVQQNALDRYHLYKTLEYRDLVKTHFARDVSQLILVCEAIDDKYKNLVTTHGINLIILARSDFLELAIKHCSKTLLESLLHRNPTEGGSLDSKSSNKALARRLEKIVFEPLDWAEHRTLADVLKHLHTELGRLGIDLENLKNRRYSSLLYEVEEFARSGIKDALCGLYRPEYWNIDTLLVG